MFPGIDAKPVVTKSNRRVGLLLLAECVPPPPPHSTRCGHLFRAPGAYLINDVDQRFSSGARIGTDATSTDRPLHLFGIH